MLAASTQQTTANSDRERGRLLTARRAGVWLLLMLSIILLSFRQYNSFQMGAWIDDASYVTLARSLLQPGGYAWLLSHIEAGPIIFPPGYPLFLAPLAALFPGSLAAMKLSSLALTLVSASLLYWWWDWFAPGFSYRWAIAVTALYSISRLTIEHTRMIMSEPLYILLSVLALMLAERSARGKGNLVQSVLLGTICAYAFAVRSVGILLLLTVFGYLIARLRMTAWRVLVPVVVAGIIPLALIGPVTGAGLAAILPARYLRSNESITGALLSPDAGVPAAETGQAGAGDPGKSKLSLLLTIYLKEGMVQRFGSDLDPLVFPIGDGPVEERITRALAIPWLPPLIGFVASSIVLLGFATCLARGRMSAFIVYGVVYLFGTLVWVSEGGRLLYPILAQLLLAFLVGVDAVLTVLLKVAARARPLPAHTRSSVLVGLVAVIAVLSVYQVMKIQDSRIHVGDLGARTRWLVENTLASDALMTEYAPIDAAYSGRRVVRYPRGCPDSAATWDYLRKHNVSYALVASHKWWQDVYVPEYTEQALCMLKALDGLSAEGRVKEIYSLAPALIRVYRVESGEEPG